MPSVWRRMLLVGPTLVTGVALLVYFTAGVSLLLALGVTIGIVGTAGYMSWRQLPANYKPAFLKRVKVGLLAGALATAAYDLFRFEALPLFTGRDWPYHVFARFGELLVGTQVSAPVMTAVGFGFHLVNGVSFAVAYSILFGRTGWWGGVAWALLLETLMVTFYPSWLGVSVIEEFVSLTMISHLIYGWVLGAVSSWRLRG